MIYDSKRLGREAWAAVAILVLAGVLLAVGGYALWSLLF